MWDYSVEDFVALSAGIMRLHVRAQRDKLVSPLLFIRRFLLAGREWPPAEVAEPYMGQLWYRHDFKHDPAVSARNRYAALVFQGSCADPQVWHFVYRDGGILHGGTPWHHHFAVLWRGQFMLSTIPYDDRSAVTVETHCGEGPAEFRVASLHPCELQLASKIPDGFPSVRFDRR